MRLIVLENKLRLTNQIKLNREEERLSKIRARELFDLDKINQLEVGTFKGLADIHYYLFQDVYFFSGKIRDENISKGQFHFVPVMYLESALKNVDKMPTNTFDEIIEKYVEMNIAHPFREGNGRSTRIWLDIILKKNIKSVIDWNLVDKEDYLLAMERSPIKDIEIKHLFKNALSDRVNDREMYLRGIDVSYYYENLTNFLNADLN